MTANPLSTTITSKVSRLLAATALYGVLLCALWVVHVHLLKVDVVFYAAMGTAVAAVLLQALLAQTTPLLRGFSPFEKFQHLFSCALIGYAVAISVPTVLDRSLSFYILEKLQQRGGGIQLARFDQVFTDEYMVEHHLVDVRLTEQAESGTIVIDPAGCVKLTAKGAQLANFSRYFRQHFLPKQRLLSDGYTDALTDPFAHDNASGFDPADPISGPDYRCR
jgi:hypothetical protein